MTALARLWRNHRLALLAFLAAAALTLVTGWDYFRKSLPHLKEAP